MNSLPRERVYSINVKMADLTKVVFTFFLSFVLTLNSLVQSQGSIISPENVHYPQVGTKMRCCTHARSGGIEVFCHQGHHKTIARMLETILLKVDLPPDQYDHYRGFTPEDVAAEFDLQHSSWSLNLFTWKSKNINLDPFNQSCIGIYNLGSKLKYDVEIVIIRIDYWRVLMLCMGGLLFLSAPKLSNNSLFYYLCGITLGISASFLILVYMFSKLLPQRPLMYGVLIGGWTVGVYMIQMLWDNLRTVLQSYQTHVLAYTAFTGLLSFVVCYRFGPVTDTRTKNLIKWFLQIAGLVMILLSSHYQEATVAITLILLTVYNFPALWVSKMKAYWKRRFPPRVKLLTDDQFHEQGVRETAKALDELRGYCSSPDCDAWRTMLKLKKPTRFASFISGSSHLNDDEILAYETESRRTFASQDSDDESSDGY